MITEFSGRIVLTCAVVVMLLSVPNDGTAQSVDVFVGLRGGLTSSAGPFEVFSNHYYPPRYDSNYSLTAWGPTVGVGVNDKFEIRVEAARYGFHYKSQSTTPYPQSGSKVTSVTEGHVWQFPVLMTYQLNSSRLFRTFLGGGVSTRSVRATTTSAITNIQFPSGAETTTVSTSTYKPGVSPVAFHASMGFEIRKGWISFRPEMRMGFWSGSKADQENQMIGSSSQAEFILGVRLHPLKIFRN